ncbi:hypothetical protein HSBAA_56490 [Vreelandella sulfidaeris]|uniref:NAD(P)-binding domain-containing protein n=1 Tax=Vreelandella sulfidaeris TaxID=115553 RepID=A0A455UG61_9GAMM|nr:hypothetical protein HSBAA_56490 [Halomonas sulfidaeris]
MAVAIKTFRWYFSLIIAIARFGASSNYVISGIGADDRYLYPDLKGGVKNKTSKSHRDRIEFYGLDSHVEADLEILRFLSKKINISTTDKSLSEASGVLFLSLSRVRFYEFCTQERVLVTGADGFIGSHLTELLVREGYRVIALSQYNSFNNWGWLEDIDCLNQVEVLSGDVRDPHYCKHITKDVDVIFI